VDETTGYRYFDERNVEQARAISYLRELMFPLADIKDLMDRFVEDSDILEFLEKHKKSINLRIDQLNRAAFTLDEIIRKEREAKDMERESSFTVGEKEIESILVAGIRWKGKYSDCGKAIGQAAKLAGRHIRGQAMSLYYDTEFKEDGADIENCFPVTEMKASGPLIVHKLPGGKCVHLVHKGPYEHLSRSYAKIMDYIQKKNYSREIYLKGPGMIFRGNPKNYLTEIQILVEER
jgi:effector-binding domain-containing protein